MQIVLQTASGNFHLELDPDEGAESIKSKVHGQLGVPPYQQHLVARLGGYSELLEAGTSLRDLNMVGRGVVVVNLQRVSRLGIQLLIRKLDGSITTLYPSTDCSILYLKRMIGDVMSTPPDHQRLIYAGTRLENGRTLSGYRITKSGCTVDLVSIVCRRFSCNMCKGNEIDLRLPNGKIFAMDVEQTDIVESLKTRVSQEAKVPIDHQALFIGHRRMENGHTVGEYWQELNRNRHEPIIIYMSSIVQVFVKLPSGQEVPFKVDVYHRVDSLKAQIEQCTGFQKDRFCLSLKVNGRAIDDDCSFSEYGIQHNTMIVMVLTVITVTMKSLAGKTFKVDVNSRGTVLDLKEAIHKSQGTPSSLQRLFFTGKHLEDWMSLPTCKVADKSTVFIVFQLSGAVTLQVKNLSGRSFQLDVDAADTVQLLKERIHRLRQIKPDEQRLVLDGQLLEEHFTICDYGIQSGAVVHIIPRALDLLQLTVMTLSQQVFTIEVESSNTVQAVKAMIERKISGATWNELYLFFAGQELENSRTLSDYGIANRSTLFLVSPENTS